MFLAGDQLRVEEGLVSHNAQTRAMAKALRDGRRLAVFNASDVGGGIHLSCGEHSASKIGNDLYSSAREVRDCSMGQTSFFLLFTSNHRCVNLSL